MVELDAITIHGFKSIATIDELKLQPINVIIGANGSGKSNFIGVFTFLHEVRDARLQDYVTRAGGADRVLHFGSKTTDTLHLRLSFRGGLNQYEIELIPTDADELVPSLERVHFWDKERFPGGRTHSEPLPRGRKEATIGTARSSPVARYVRDHLDRWRVYHLHDTSSSSPMKKTADVDDNRFLRPDGANLAAFLYLLREKHNDSYDLIRRTVQQVAPFFDDFRVEPQQLNPEKIRLEWKHGRSEAFFDASSLSDGTLRFMALATLFLQPESLRPSVILVDEPELGLHPYAITLLASLVKQVAVTTQVVLSSQSPILLDHFAPEDVLVADRVDGGTRLTRLDSTQLAAWLEEFSLGQLWEKNEFGGRPTEEFSLGQLREKSELGGRPTGE